MINITGGIAQKRTRKMDDMDKKHAGAYFAREGVAVSRDGETIAAWYDDDPARGVVDLLDYLRRQDPTRPIGEIVIIEGTAWDFMDNAREIAGIGAGTIPTMEQWGEIADNWNELGGAGLWGSATAGDMERIAGLRPNADEYGRPLE